jgi:hypothetical protein
MECVREGVRSSNYSAVQPSTHTHVHLHVRYSPRFTSACVTAQNARNSDPTSPDGSYTATPGAGSVTQFPTLPSIPARPIAISVGLASRLANIHTRSYRLRSAHGIHIRTGTHSSHPLRPNACGHLSLERDSEMARERGDLGIKGGTRCLNGRSAIFSLCPSWKLEASIPSLRAAT